MKKLLLCILFFTLSLSSFNSCSKKHNSYVRLELEFTNGKPAEEFKERTMEVLKTRFNLLDISDVLIKEKNNNSIVIDIPSEFYQSELKWIIQKRGLLEFRLLKDPEFTFSVMQKVDEVLAGKVTDDATHINKSLTSAPSEAPQKELSLEEFKKEHPFFAIAMINPQGNTADAYVREDERSKLQSILNRPDIQSLIPNNVEFMFSVKPVTVQNGKGIYVLYLVNKTPELTGDVITDANANIDPNTSKPIITMSMNSEGAIDWARITGANINKRIAIIFDGVVFSTPKVYHKITSGNSQIGEGIENMEEANLLEVLLKSGHMPLTLELVSENIIKE